MNSIYVAWLARAGWETLAGQLGRGEEGLMANSSSIAMVPTGRPASSRMVLPLGNSVLTSGHWTYVDLTPDLALLTPGQRLWGLFQGLEGGNLSETLCAGLWH